MTNTELLGWFTVMFGMIGFGALGIWMVVGLGNIGKDRKKEQSAESK